MRLAVAWHGSQPRSSHVEVCALDGPGHGRAWTTITKYSLLQGCTPPQAEMLAACMSSLGGRFFVPWLALMTQMDSIVKPFLIDYDSTQSLVLFDGEREVACCNLVPPFPDFPSEWSATVEANIVNDGYTYVQREMYSAAQVCTFTRSYYIASASARTCHASCCRFCQP